MQQVIVPAYVWADVAQRKALLTHIGAAARRTGGTMRENLDHENATVTPVGLKAAVAHADVDGVRTAFIAYDQVPVEHADLVTVVVDFPVIPS